MTGGLWLSACSTALFAQQNTSNMNDTQKASYAYGVNLARGLKSQGATDIDSEQLLRGFVDAQGGKSLQFSEAEMNTFLQTYFTAAQARLKEINKQEGMAFLAENGKKVGVVTTASGLQYQILKEGNGPKPSATSTVSTHYHGTLIDGTVFDSSVERGQPASFPVNRVIAGWTEALQLMPVGSKWRLFIPSNLAYGERGAGDDIGPNTALIFDVELLAIEKP